MPLIALAIVLLLPLALLALMPVMLIQRYRLGRSRRLARPWVAGLNVVAMALSALLFLASAALANVWVPSAFAYSTFGMAAGGAIGLLGVWLSRWEPTHQALHYTPNRWLVLAVTLLVTARLLYGAVRGVAAWTSGADRSVAIATFGIPGSLAIGAVVVGYYFAYAIGVRWRIRRWQQSTSRTRPTRRPPVRP